nr:2OG-Fe(II) oxygenase [Actinomadura oligospora]
MNQPVPAAEPLFGLPTAGGAAPRVPHDDLLPELGTLDWDGLFERLNDQGVALTPPLLSRAQCEEVTATFDDPGLFRSTVVMQRYDFGRGTYKYYADPAAIPLIGTLRERLYPPLAWMANQWAAQLGERTFPGTLSELAAECAGNGQVRPTPLILRYGPGDHACLHQDVYGDIVFPLQIAVMLNQPGEDFTGGENVFVEHAPAPSPGPSW